MWTLWGVCAGGLYTLMSEGSDVVRLPISTSTSREPYAGICLGGEGWRVQSGPRPGSRAERWVAMCIHIRERVLGNVEGILEGELAPCCLCGVQLADLIARVAAKLSDLLCHFLVRDDKAELADRVLVKEILLGRSGGGYEVRRQAGGEMEGASTPPQEARAGVDEEVRAQGRGRTLTNCSIRLRTATRRFGFRSCVGAGWRR